MTPRGARTHGLVAVLAACALPFPALAQAASSAAPAVFAAKCAACHSAGGWGTRTLARRIPPDQAELAHRKDLDVAYVRYVVRHGIGSMPQFTPTDLGDAALRDLAGWLANDKAPSAAGAPGR